MKTIPLYNNDGTLSTEAQFLLTPKPESITRGEWLKRIKDFKTCLSVEDVKTFKKLKRAAIDKTFRQKNKETRKVYQKAYNGAYHEANKEKLNADSRAYHEANKEKLNADSRAYYSLTKQARNDYSKTYYNANKKKSKVYSSTYYYSNKEKQKAYNRAYFQQNKEDRRAYTTKYARTRRQKDPLYRFFHNIRSQAVRVVKQVGLGKKPTNTFKWVGCSPEELKAHIESLFLEGMNWSNYGKYGWHVDHVRPVSSFKPEEWEQINHYTNLQPLWAKDNLSKGDKFNQEFIS